MRGDQFDAARCDLRAQRVAFLSAVANDSLWFLAGSSTATSVCYPDRSDRFFGEPGSPSFLKNSVSRTAGLPRSGRFFRSRLVRWDFSGVTSHAMKKWTSLHTDTLDMNTGFR